MIRNRKINNNSINEDSRSRRFFCRFSFSGVLKIAFMVRVPNSQLSRYLFFELGGLNSTGLGWFGLWFCLQLVNFAEEGPKMTYKKIHLRPRQTPPETPAAQNAPQQKPV